MDREALARAARRRQAREALEFEREREAMLVEQLEDRLAEAEGARLDEAAFAAMDPADAQLAREALFGAPAEDFLDDDEFGEYLVDMDDPGEDEDSPEDEVTRLEEQLGACRRRQRALESYLVALGD